MDLQALKGRASRLKVWLPTILVLYILNKNLLDWMTFGGSKLVYYSLLFVGAALGALKMLRNERLRGIVFAFGAYCILVLVNGLLFSNFNQLKEGIKTYLTFPLPLFALWSYMDSREARRPLLKLPVYWGGVTSVLGIAEYLLGHSVLPGFEGRIYTFADGSSVYRATVFIGSPLSLGILLGAALILAMYYFHKERKLRYGLLSILILGGLLSTASRAPLLLSLVGVCVMYLQFYRQGTVPKALVYALVGLAAAGVAVLALFRIFPELSTGIEQLDFLIYRLNSTFDFTGEWGNSGRVKIWTHYISEYLQRPLFGYGIATTSADVAGNRWIYFGTFWQIVTESGVLARLVETGLIGALSYYLFLSKCITPVFTRGNLRPRALSRNHGIFALTGVLVLLFLEDIILQISLDIYCMFLLSFVLAYALREDGCKGSPEVYRRRPFLREVRRELAERKFASQITANQHARILVILHLYYQQSWQEIEEYLKNLTHYDFDLIVTFSKGNVDPSVLEQVRSFPNTRKIILCDNRGFDLGPFFSALREVELDDYDMVFKLQSKSTKRSMLYIYRQLFLRRDWFVSLYEGILGAENAHRTVDILLNREDAGLVAADHLLVEDPLHKRQLIARWAQREGSSLPEDYRFVAGTCFAVRARCLKALQARSITAEQFVDTASSRGLSYAHYIERYLCTCVMEQGYTLVGNPTCPIRRALKKPLEALLFRFSSERLLEENVLVDPEFFLWQLDNKLITYRYETIPVGSLMYSHEDALYPFTQCPPYRYLCGDREGYETYCDYHQRMGLPQMTHERFDRLRSSIEANGYDPRHVILVGDRRTIMDGQHRACCICHTFGEEAPIRVLHIRFLGIKPLVKRLLPPKTVRLLKKLRNGD